MLIHTKGACTFYLRYDVCSWKINHKYYWVFTTTWTTKYFHAFQLRCTIIFVQSIHVNIWTQWWQIYYKCYLYILNSKTSSQIIKCFKIHGTIFRICSITKSYIKPYIQWRSTTYCPSLVPSIMRSNTWRQLLGKSMVVIFCQHWVKGIGKHLIMLCFITDVCVCKRTGFCLNI